ncbi:hypothetical protein Sta7437_3380 [Stanieria cyanosphaera PCC 7437]|uniref:DUF2231 domain-containing protein n=1 Tax=Stanieria cyanosphaera (strain ATCC 29371 / PCC 7437) TaxID=111780 RepID=K9XXQ5_STAC7|nr:DUF2231 domain-containing protein [Stanieria cyanosphaera]AFZ36886.1 hypothetical protein Sta7437_3380 [Stanieria cyanosphaera PCC 7437]
MQNINVNQESDSDNQVPYPNLPPLIESRQTEYVGSGVTSSVSIAGHPIHPVIVIFPVAFLSGAAGADIGYWLSEDFFWARAAFWLIGIGGLSGILAALIGIFDFVRVPRVRKRTAGWAHMLINVAALILTFVNFGLRLGNPVINVIPTGIIISLIVATLLAVGGWYGGELTFRHKVGVIGAEHSS